MKGLLITFSLVASIVIFNSCSSERYVVTERPVAPVYARPAIPGPGYVWVDGDWRWQGRHYVYTNGYWARPKRTHVYVTGTWVKTNRGYYWKRGYWR